MIGELINHEVEKLPKNLQKEWYYKVSFYSTKKDSELFEDFKKRYDNFTGTAIEEFVNIPEVVYSEWQNWKCIQNYEIKQMFSQAWFDFKNFWDYDNPKTKVMFDEIKLLSKNMIYEWRLKYNFDYPHVYEKNYYHTVQINYRLKTKVQLWDEFKEIWEIDTMDYNEDRYNEMIEYIYEIVCDNTNYFKDYPRNFYEYREDANYHSFDSYSVIEKMEICEYWEMRCQDTRDIESDCD